MARSRTSTRRRNGARPTMVDVARQARVSLKTVSEPVPIRAPPRDCAGHGQQPDPVLVLRALATMRGWRPALIGFDDLELADLLRPPLTVIEQDASELGRIAAELLFSRIAGDRRPVQRVVLPTRLVPRGSGERRR